MLQFVEFLSSSDEECEEISLKINKAQNEINDDSYFESQPTKSIRPSKDKENQAKKQETIALIKQLNMQYVIQLFML